MTLRIDVVTIFPSLFEPFLAESFPAIAQQKGLANFGVHDLRDWTEDRHRSVDDSPYGGGAGMVLKPEPLVGAIEALAGPRQGRPASVRTVALSPQGRPLDQPTLTRLATLEHLVLVCGRYEGFDERALELAVDEQLSLGDYVLSGGEIPAMAVIEGVVRLIPGVLGNPESAVTESFADRSQAQPGDPDERDFGGALLEGPHYTRPPIFRGLGVPEVLRSGDHAAIARWREAQALARTRERRPDLLAEASSDPSQAHERSSAARSTSEPRSPADGAAASANRTTDTDDPS